MEDFNLVSTDPNLNPYADNIVGLPSYSSVNQGGEVAGLPSQIDPVMAPILATVQKSWNGIESFYEDIYKTGKKAASAVYGDVKEGVSTVVTDVAEPVKATLTGTYWYLLLAVGVIGVILVMTAKSGAIKVNAKV